MAVTMKARNWSHNVETSLLYASEVTQLRTLHGAATTQNRQVPHCGCQQFQHMYAHAPTRRSEQDSVQSKHENRTSMTLDRVGSEASMPVRCLIMRPTTSLSCSVRRGARDATTCSTASRTLALLVFTHAFSSCGRTLLCMHAALILVSGAFRVCRTCTGRIGIQLFAQPCHTILVICIKIDMRRRLPASGEALHVPAGASCRKEQGTPLLASVCLHLRAP